MIETCIINLPGKYYYVVIVLPIIHTAAAVVVDVRKSYFLIPRTAVDSILSRTFSPASGGRTSCHPSHEN